MSDDSIGSPASVEDRAGEARYDRRVLDFIGVGFGPSNLALAIAAREIDRSLQGQFFEMKSSFRWHPGMMIDDSKMQASFLKDAVTLRNPASPYTFLQYLKSKGRLERFVNLREFHPSRREYEDYLIWAAEAFRDQVRYGTTVTAVTPVRCDDKSPPSAFRVDVRRAGDRTVASYRARNVVYACGARPRIPKQCSHPAPSIIHSSEFLDRFPAKFLPHSGERNFAVVGEGQSAGEIVAYLMRRYPRCRVHLFLAGYAPRPVDSSPFLNEAFFSKAVDEVFSAAANRRAGLARELRNANYGVMSSEVIEEIYRAAYSDEVKGEQRLFIRNFATLLSAQQNADQVELTIQSLGGETISETCDAVVLATGYERSFDPLILKNVLPFAETDHSGEVVLSRNYRLRTRVEMDCGFYLQGYSENSHGIGDTLLSLLPFRAKEIFDDIRANVRSRNAGAGERAVRAPVTLGGAQHGEYPPKRHLETDSDKLYAIIERFNFATLVSVKSDGEPVVTHVPMVLDRSQSEKGILFGHMDRANPHVDSLDGRRTLAIFHGPNAYISPHTYESDQLPTWNSIAVHVRGMTRVIVDREKVVRGLVDISVKSDSRQGAFRLPPDDPRIERLINFIVGFEIEIEEMVGRFKLSQDRSEADRKLAGFELMRQTATEQLDTIRCILGL